MIAIIPINICIGQFIPSKKKIKLSRKPYDIDVSASVRVSMGIAAPIPNDANR
jgi:hypothetical protein